MFKLIRILWTNRWAKEKNVEDSEYICACVCVFVCVHSAVTEAMWKETVSPPVHCVCVWVCVNRWAATILCPTSGKWNTQIHLFTHYSHANKSLLILFNITLRTHGEIPGVAVLTRSFPGREEDTHHSSMCESMRLHFMVVQTSWLSCSSLLGYRVRRPSIEGPEFE